jgi:hypothetical protein
MNIYKSIAYAYPTSIAASELGYYKDGCYFVQIRNHHDGEITTTIEHNCEGYKNPDDPDLISFFNETEGTICPYFAEHGNASALKALANLK